MITITENKSVKSVGQTSLFVSFDYDPKKVELIKCADNAVWHKDKKLWELPLNKLAYLIDNFTLLDDIQLNIYESSEGADELNLTIDYKTKPFEHQLEAIKWLINVKNGLLLDVPGLGKTLDVIYAAEELKAQKGAEHCLIICGINTLKQNWKKEIQTHSNLDCVVIGEKINSKGTITYAPIKARADQLYNPIKEFFVIINIESLTDSIIIDAIKNSKNNFDIIVFDELHKAKGATTSQRSKNLMKLAKLGTYHYGLTGTPLINSPLDCYIPLKFVGYEKSTYSNFKAFYCNIEMMFGHQNIVGFKNIDLLKKELDACSLRRTKDLLNLPPKIRIPEYLEMPTSQQDFYSDLQNGIIAEADRVNIKNTSLLGMITRLRQATTCPTVLTSKSIDNVKIDRALELIEEITSNGEKVIVFSTFKEPLYTLKDLLKDALLCTGDQTEEEINKSIELFQTPDNSYKIVLCTTQKMGTGITLTAASYEIFLDTPWTFAELEQAEDRAYRIGTTKSVIIYNLIAKGTIDERVKYLVDTKKDLSDFIVDDKYNETERLKYLLGL